MSTLEYLKMQSDAFYGFYGVKEPGNLKVFNFSLNNAIGEKDKEHLFRVEELDKNCVEIITGRLGVDGFEKKPLAFFNVTITSCRISSGDQPIMFGSTIAVKLRIFEPCKNQYKDLSFIEECHWTAPFRDLLKWINNINLIVKHAGELGDVDSKKIKRLGFDAVQNHIQKSEYFFDWLIPLEVNFFFEEITRVGKDDQVNLNAVISGLSHLNNYRKNLLTDAIKKICRSVVVSNDSIEVCNFDSYFANYLRRSNPVSSIPDEIIRDRIFRTRLMFYLCRNYSLAKDLISQIASNENEVEDDLPAF